MPNAVLTNEAIRMSDMPVLARILTDKPILRSPDCAAIGRTPCFGHGARFSDQIIR
jgi:hypothetical protein